MKAATVHELKKEIELLEAQEIATLCLRLAKFKKENKELLTYLLFEARDEHAYVEEVKSDMAEQFKLLPALSVYFMKKGLRKILRTVNKQIKYSAIPQTELALRIYFCEQVQEANIPIQSSVVLTNLYQQQLKKIDQVLRKLPEDLQFDYQSAIDNLKS